jgi:hypothetical protein
MNVLLVPLDFASQNKNPANKFLQPGSEEPVTRQEIEQKMDELAREYRETHDPEIPEEIFELARRLKEMEH